MMRCVCAVLAALVLVVPPAIGRQDTLPGRLARLPVAVGENTTGVWPAGTAWTDLGMREHLGYEHLRRANGANFAAGRDLLLPGRHLAERGVKDGLVLNVPEMMLYHWSGGTPVAWYPVAVGRARPPRHSPLGTHRIISRLKFPTWRGVPPGPRNPLGDRWMGISKRGYGIHGTNKPDSIGRTVSGGCVRMFPPHARELFEHVTVGMTVIYSYRTVQAGYGDGTVYLAVFPDVYGKGTNRPAAVRTRLADLGLAGALTDAQIDAAVRAADGVAHPVLGSTTPVTLNGTPIALPLGPTERDGVTYLPVRALATALGADLTYDPATRNVTLTRAEQVVTLTPADGFTALGSYFAPLRAVVEGLGGTVTVDEGTVAVGM